MHSKPVRELALLSVADVSTELGLSPRVVREWCRSGRLPAVREGRAGRFRIDPTVLPVVRAGEHDLETARARAAAAERRAAAAERRACEAERRAEDSVRRCRELERHVSSQRRLLEVSEKLLLTLEPDAVLETLGGWLRGVVAYDSMSIHEADGGALRPAMFATDAYARVVRDPGTSADRGLGGWVLRNGEAVRVNTPDAEPSDTADSAGRAGRVPHAVIVLPLSIGGRVTGAIFISRLGRHAHFSDHEFELAKLFAGQASMALANAHAHRAATDRAQRDSLTGLLNHGAFQAEILELIGRNGPFAMVMLDLDEFKGFNDKHGHPAGDGLLQSIARAMGSATREADGLYRYGGDEFAVLLPGASRGQAAVVAQRIQAAVEAVETGNGAAAITVSAGIACFPADGRTPERLIARADEQLYLTKRKSPKP